MAKSDCTNIVNLIPLYIDNMLSEEENDIVCEHIANCESCRNEYAFLKSIMAGTNNLPEIEVPNDFHENLMAKIRAEQKGKAVHKRRFLGWRSFAGIAAAAAVVAVSVVSYLNLDGNETSVNPDEFVPSTYPSSVPDNKLTPTDEVVLPGTEGENSNGNDEHTQSVDTDPGVSEKNKTETAPQAPETSRQEKQPEQEDRSQAHGNVSDAEADDSLKPQTSAAPLEAQNTDMLEQNQQAPASTSAPAAQDLLPENSDNDIATFHTDEAQDSNALPNVAANGADDSNLSGSSGSGNQGSGGGSSARNPASSERAATFRIIRVTVAQEEISKAKDILDSYVKDEVGYRMGQDAEIALDKLSKLNGFRSVDDVAADINSDYIVLEEES